MIVLQKGHDYLQEKFDEYCISEVLDLTRKNIEVVQE